MIVTRDRYGRIKAVRPFLELFNFPFELPITPQMMTKVLAVEDDATIASLLEVIFDGSAYELRVAQRLTHARELLAADPPHVVLLDMVLPDGTGEALLPEIPRGVPVIAMTGSDRLLRDTGQIVAFVPKPFDPEALFWVLDSVSRKKEIRAV